MSDLCGQVRLDRQLATTVPGLVRRIAHRRLAVTLGMLNLLTGRPPPALAAHEGR